MADAIPTPTSGEQWRPVVGWEDLYEVSDHGRVRRSAAGAGGTWAGRVLIFDVSNRGYLRAALTRHNRTRRRTVHHLVLEAFVGPRPSGQQCNHRDGDKTNNRLGNLEWATPGGNIRHAWDTGLSQARRGEHHHAAKLTEADVVEIRRLRGLETTRVTAARYGVNQSQISAIQTGVSWRGVR